MKYNEINHFAHPHHNLKFDHSEAPFKCDGCREAGIGSRYRCNGGADDYSCNFDLHTHCAIPSSSVSHPFYPKCTFQFLMRPPGQVARYCNACRKDVTGFVYHCRTCGFDLHPCCAKLPMLLYGDGDGHGDAGGFKLYLYKTVSSSCHRCGRKGRSWSYRSSCKKYNFHVACVKEMLVESWHEIYYGAWGCTYTGPGGSRGLAPTLSAALVKHNHSNKKSSSSKGKSGKCCDMAALALQFVVSALLGDPATLIAGAIGALLSA